MTSNSMCIVTTILVTLQQFNMKQGFKVVAVVLHLLLISNFSDANNEQFNNMTVELPNESLCHNDTCHVTRRNFIDLQRMIGSNRIIVFEKATFTVAEEFDPININHVFNLTIQGHEDGTTIHCPHMRFSFGFNISNNVRDITFRGVRIDSCAAHMYTLLGDLIFTTILIEGRNVTLANLHVQYSPAFSVVVYGTITFFSEYNDLFWIGDNRIVIKNCTFSNSQHGTSEQDSR